MIGDLNNFFSERIMSFGPRSGDKKVLDLIPPRRKSSLGTFQEADNAVAVVAPLTRASTYTPRESMYQEGPPSNVFRGKVYGPRLGDEKVKKASSDLTDLAAKPALVKQSHTPTELISLTDRLDPYTQQVDNAASHSALIYSKLSIVKAHVAGARKPATNLLGLQIEVDSLLASLADHLPATVRGTATLADEVMALRQRRNELQARVDRAVNHPLRTVRHVNVAAPAQVDALTDVTRRLQKVREDLAGVEEPLEGVVCRLQPSHHEIAEQVCDQRDGNFLGPLAALAKQMDDFCKRQKH